MSRQPQDPRDLANYIKRLEARVEALETRSPYANTGMKPTDDGVVTIDGNLIVDDGDARSGNYVPGSAGWRLRSDGTIEMNDAAIRGGIIGNDALAEPVSPVAGHADAQSFNPGVAWSTVCSTGLTVPAGYTRLLIVTFATNATAHNQSAATDFLYVRGFVNGSGLGGWVLGSADVLATGTGVAFNYQTGLVTGLTGGGTVTFSAQVSTAFASWTSSVSNIANLDVAGLWLR